MAITSTADINRICQLVKSRAGIVITDDRLPQIREIVQELMAEVGIKQFEDYYWMISQTFSGDVRFQSLINKITIGETYFFRDTEQFRALREIIIPDLLEKQEKFQRNIYILSAACSTGEEIYSLAMLLQETVPKHRLDRFKLTAGDINTTSLEKAERGVYGKWSFRGVDPYIQQKYFKHIGDNYLLAESVRQMVKFQYMNLAEDFPYVDLDLIIMRNVIIYFSFNFIQEVATHCEQALREGGWLLVGASELNRQYFPQFEEVALKNTTAYRRQKKLMTLGDFSPSALFPAKSVNSAPNLLPQAPMLKPITGKVPAYQPAQPPAANPEPLPQAPKLKPITSKVPAYQTPTASQPVSADIYQQAYQAYQKKDFTRAEALLVPIMQTDLPALLLMAKIAASRNNSSKSIELLLQYLSKKPGSLEAHYLLGLVYQNNNSVTQAAEEFRYTIFLDRSFIMGHWHLLLLYQKLNDKQTAERHLIQAKRLLSLLAPDTEVPFSDGQKASRMLQIMDMMIQGNS